MRHGVARDAAGPGARRARLTARRDLPRRGSERPAGPDRGCEAAEPARGATDDDAVTETPMIRVHFRSGDRQGEAEQVKPLPGGRGSLDWRLSLRVMGLINSLPT